MNDFDPTGWSDVTIKVGQPNLIVPRDRINDLSMYRQVYTGAPFRPYDIILIEDNTLVVEVSERYVDTKRYFLGMMDV